MKWFRLYHDVIDDPKIGLLPESEQLLWFKLLCLASMGEDRGIIAMNDDEICFRLRISVEFWRCVKDKFRVKGLIECAKNGATKICNWDKRQYDSDSSTERTRAYRRKQKAAQKNTGNVTRTSQERPSDALDTDTEEIREDTDTEREADQSVREEPAHAIANSNFGFVLADVVEPEVSEAQLALIEVEPPHLGEERSKSTEGAKVPPSISSAKKFEAFKERFKATYNERKPDSFSRIDVVNEPRSKFIKQFLKDCGNDEESALLVLSNALDYAASNTWYCSRDLSFENIASKGKIIQLHERQVAKGMNGRRFATEREAKMAQTYARYASFLGVEVDHAS